MEGLGEGYEAFVERLQSDFNASKASGQDVVVSTSGSSLRRMPLAPHPPHSQINQAKYVAYPSLANAFTLQREDSSFALDSSAVRGRHGYEKEEIIASSGLIGVNHTYSTDLSEKSDIPYRQRGHRRAQSEIPFRLPDDIIFDYQPGVLGSSSPATDQGERLLEMNLNENLSSSSAMMPFPGKNVNASEGLHTSYSTVSHHARSLSVDHVLADFGINDEAFALLEETWMEPRAKPKHCHSKSMDGHSNMPKESASSESSKTFSDSKLAELALIDPKRAKRIIANRQSAARSKERKMRYIAELERKVQALQTEATALSAQLTLMQNDTTVLTQENNELKFQLQNIKQQTQQSNDLHLYLKEQFQRLKIAIGETGMDTGQIVSHEDHPVLSNKSFY